MDLYKLNNPAEDNTYFYARDPEHIIELIQQYRKKVTEKERQDPKLVNWVKSEPTLDQIVKVKEGSLCFQAGMICMDTKGELFEHLQVTPDFTVHVNVESLPYFDLARTELPEHKRGKLYKMHCPGSIFQGLYFLPEDIIKAIVAYDLTELYKKGDEYLGRIADLRHQHVQTSIRRIGTG